MFAVLCVCARRRGAHPEAHERRDTPRAPSRLCAIEHGLRGPNVTFNQREASSLAAIALLVRQQFRPGPVHLFRDPAAVHGAMPGSEVDWELRIDYAQHAGSAMVRWLRSQP